MSDVSSLKDTIVPKSDRINADDFLAGAETVTVTAVKRGDADTPVAIHLEGKKPYYPCKSMRRVLIACWGDDGRAWVGRQMTLFCDPEVVFGGVKVGGIRISHLSHIDSDLTLSLTKTRGKKAPFVVRRLTSSKPEAKPAAEPIEQPFYDAEKFEANFQAWADLIASGKKTADQIIAAVQKCGRLTVGQVDRIKAVKLAADDRGDPPAELDDGDPFLGQE